jgi:hypothetical protein
MLRIMGAAMDNSSFPTGITPILFSLTGLSLIWVSLFQIPVCRDAPAGNS